ncbi:helix-turn-helix domain-containing protein [Amycolatopsis jejuensis]|uniref:helix-turn-helix domain-containing protein n=1 Tax=Amycolatopsis jejuensis TaxID=330084 RepID=UPI00068FA415|nr:helix-turn-helix domain-containing protein [Amycolatopsis jejuensis]
MSIEAINWALKHAHIPHHRRDASSLAVVLIGLANHADPDGHNAFPSLATLTAYTRLTERSVRYALRHLQQLGLITPADPRIVAAHVHRADRRPNGYDLTMTTTTPNQGQTVPTADQHEGHNTTPRAANNTPTRGNHCPRNIPQPSMNQRPPAPRAPTHIPPPCGGCDARPGDPIATRSTTDENGNVKRCPDCHPAEIQHLVMTTYPAAKQPDSVSGRAARTLSRI